MQFVTEHRISHREWDVVKLDPRDFFTLFERFFKEDEEGDSPLCAYSYMPTFIFENGTVQADEMWGVRDGRVWTSSEPSGIMSYQEDKGQYVKHVRFLQTELGSLTGVELNLNDALREALEAL